MWLWATIHKSQEQQTTLMYKIRAPESQEEPGLGMFREHDSHLPMHLAPLPGCPDGTVSSVGDPDRGSSPSVDIMIITEALSRFGMNRYHLQFEEEGGRGASVSCLAWDESSSSSSPPVQLPPPLIVGSARGSLFCVMPAAMCRDDVLEDAERTGIEEGARFATANTALATKCPAFATLVSAAVPCCSLFLKQLTFWCMLLLNGLARVGIPHQALTCLCWLFVCAELQNCGACTTPRQPRGLPHRRRVPPPVLLRVYGTSWHLQASRGSVQSNSARAWHRGAPSLLPGTAAWRPAAPRRGPPGKFNMLMFTLHETVLKIILIVSLSYCGISLSVGLCHLADAAAGARHHWPGPRRPRPA